MAIAIWRSYPWVSVIRSRLMPLKTRPSADERGIAMADALAMRAGLTQHWQMLLKALEEVAILCDDGPAESSGCYDVALVQTSFASSTKRHRRPVRPVVATRSAPP
jgi:hypothetical protein